MTMIAEADEMERLAMAQCIGRLKMELIGIAFRQPTLQLARQRWPLAARTKKAALAELEALFEQTYGYRFGGRMSSGVGSAAEGA